MGAVSVVGFLRYQPGGVHPAGDLNRMPAPTAVQLKELDDKLKNAQEQRP